MRLISMNCPNCGSQLSIDTDASQAFCTYCGSKLFVDDEKTHVVYDNAEDAGYQFEKGRQRAQTEQAQQEARIQTYIYQPQELVQEKKKHSLFFWIILWLFCWPVALTLVIARSEKLSKTTKIILTAAIWTVIGLAIVANAGDTIYDKLGIFFMSLALGLLVLTIIQGIRRKKNWLYLLLATIISFVIAMFFAAMAPSPSSDTEDNMTSRLQVNLTPPTSEYTPPPVPPQ